jgi:hypothetical protein
MSLSAEEKEALRLEDLRKRARGLRMKLIEAPSRADEILGGLDAESEDDHKLLESLLWEEMIRSLPADETAFRQLDVMEKLPQARRMAKTISDARSLLKSAMKSRSQERQKILVRERKRLAAFGISGTAVVPKIPKETKAGSDFDVVIEKVRRLLNGDSRETGIGHGGSLGNP